MDPLAELRSWWKVPCIAHFCSLFRGVLFEQSDLDIEDLEEALLNAKSPGDSPVILDLLCSLLEGIYGREKLTVVDYDKYLKDIFRYQHAMGNIKRNPLVEKTFFDLSLRQKVDVLHDLCDFRLESEDVMEVLKGHDGDNMRVEPLGHDVNGATYWYFYGTRLYQEDPPPKEPEEEKSSPKHKHKKKKKKSEREERAEKRKLKRKEQRQAKKERDAAKVAKEERVAEKVGNVDETEISENGHGTRQLPSRRSKRIAVENLTGIMTEEEMEEKIEDEEDNYDQETGELASDVQISEGSKLDVETKGDNSQIDLKEELLINEEKILNSPKLDNESEISETTSKALALENLSPGVKTEIEDEDKNDLKTIINDLADISSGVADALTQIQDNIDKLEEDIKVKDEEIDSKDEVKFNIIGQQLDFKEELDSKDDIINDNKDLEIKEDIKVEVKMEDEQNENIAAEVAVVMAEVLDQLEGCHSEEPMVEEFIPEPSQVASEVEVETNGIDCEEMEVEDTSTMEMNDIETLNEADPKLTEEEEEEPQEPSRWHMVCSTLEDWQNLAEFFKESEVKCEKALYRTIVEDFLPEIPSIVAEREKELARREVQNAPRRQSCRLEVKRIEQEELEKIKASQIAEEEKQKLLEEERRMERVRQMKIEDQKRAREERERVREERANRIKKREERARLMAEGIEIPEELRNLDSPPPEPEVRVKNLVVDNEVTITMYKILDNIKNHADAWLFWEPVEESFAPGYFDVVKKPMDLTRIEAKINEREYKTTDDFVSDVHLMFDNCILYNGTDSDYAYMAENLRNHLKKVCKKLMPKEDDDKTFEPIIREPRTKVVRVKKRVEPYQHMYENEVYKDIRKCPPTKSSGTFKHGNYMVHMSPLKKVSKDKVFREVDREIEAYKANQADKKYTKLPALALYPPTQEETPVVDPNDPLANRFKRKVDPANVMPKVDTKPVEVGKPKVETLVSAENPAIKKNIWHISQEDMVKYRKIAQENNGFVEIKGPEGKTLKLQFKTVPKAPGISSTPVSAGTPSTPVSVATPGALSTPGKTPSVPTTTKSDSIETQKSKEDTPAKAEKTAEETSNSGKPSPVTPSSDSLTKKQEVCVTEEISRDKTSESCEDTENLKKAAEIAVDAFKKMETEQTPKKSSSKKNTTLSDKSKTTEESQEVGKPDVTNLSSDTSEELENAIGTQSDESNKPSAGVQAEDYESFKKNVEASNKNKPKYDPFKKKSSKPKNPNKKLSLENLEKKIREGETLGEMTKIKEKKNSIEKKKKDKNLNGVIIRGVHHSNGIELKQEEPKKKKPKVEVIQSKGNDSDFEEEDDVPLKKLWHPVQQNPDKLKLKISRGEIVHENSTPSKLPASDSDTPSKGILKKIWNI